MDYPAASGTLTFAAGVTSQTFPVRVNDEDLSEHHETFLVRLSNPVNATLSDAVATGTITDDDRVTIQVGVTLSRQTLTVPEGGSNTYEVVLGHQPTGDVTVTVTVDDTANNDVTTEEGSLVFTTANWNEPKTVTVRAAEDDDAITDDDVSISHTVGGANYEGVTAPGLTVSITEDDEVGVTILPTTLTVTEGDATGVSYTVVLTSQPAGDVKVTVSGHSGTDLTLSGTGLSEDGDLTFTTENWGTAQTVTVKAAEDDDAVTDDDVTLAHAISSTDDTAYSALADQSVTVSITENDSAGVTITPTSMTVLEGRSNSYTVVLTSQPTADVTVAISGHSGTALTLSGTTLTNDYLTFTSSNWNTPQTVTVTAGTVTTDTDVTLVHAISSTDDSVYNALADQSVTVSITENDASLCQMLWKLPPGGLAHQAATASSALTGNSVKIPSSNRAPSISKPIRFLPPFSGRQRSLSLSDTLNTRYNALSRLFIRRVASVLNLTALNTDSNGLVVRRCTQCSTGKS